LKTIICRLPLAHGFDKPPGNAPGNISLSARARLLAHLLEFLRLSK
jgi:hypothetical protein